MLKRKMYDAILKWRKEKNRECLFLNGARQTGKTYLIEQLGKDEYASFIEINFMRDGRLKNIFSGDLGAEDIYKRMSAMMPGIRLIPGRTLIFLDEIQKCARARTALKFLAEDNRYDIIASGSLLGLHYGQDDDPDVEEIESVPVGYESHMTMYSLDFEEFLWALGYESGAIEYLREYFDKKIKVPYEVNEQYENLLREYICVGGMPEVVKKYSKNKNFGEAHRIQQKILSTYDDDIASHARGAEKVKVRECYKSIPRQLARENKKFMYSEVEKKATARKYFDSVSWLSDSKLVHVCSNVYEPYIPLEANKKENEYKLYVNDTGLLMSMYGTEAKLAVLNNTIKGNAKGGIYENLISEMLIKKGYGLCYYKRRNSTQEIEFLIEKNGGVVPVEVKAGNRDTPSLDRFIRENNSGMAYKLIDGNIGVNGAKLSIPHYMGMFL